MIKYSSLDLHQCPLLFILLIVFLPIGASDTCFRYFFSCPPGPRIPALLFFFIAHRGRGYLLRFFFYIASGALCGCSIGCYRWFVALRDVSWLPRRPSIAWWYATHLEHWPQVAIYAAMVVSGAAGGKWPLGGYGAGRWVLG